MKKIKITFKDKKSKLIFDSFSEDEMNEMQKDILELSKKIETETKKVNLYQGKIDFNQRILDKNLSGIIQFDLTPNQIASLCFENLQLLSIDEYLDSINRAKKLDTIGYKRL
jgi:hypothetical protein